MQRKRTFERIEAVIAGASLAELIAAEQEANRLVQELGFPFSTAIDVEGNREVLDREGSVVARVGEQVSLTAAGETDWESKLRQPLPDQCPGPTWVMDGIVRK